MNPTAFSPWQRFWMGIALVIVGYFALGYVFSLLFPPASLSVLGEGSVSVTPEKASMIVTRVNSSRDATRSIDEGEAGIQVLIDSAKSVAGEDAKIQKSFYQLSPVPTQELVNGAVSVATIYQLANAFSVETTNVTRVNELVKTLYQDGATTVSNISFTTNNEIKTEQEARVLAVKDAREKAKQIAKSAGKRLGRMISIADDNLAASSTIGTGGDSAAKGSLNTIDITKRVQVVYELW